MRLIRSERNRVFCCAPARVVAVLAILGMTAAAGCSTSTRYYTLSPVDAAGSPAARPATGSAVVAVGPVVLPDYVDRPQIVVRTGANTLDQATFDQWGGALDDMVPRLLVEDLALRLPGDHVVSFPQASDVAWDVRIPVDISQFDVTASGEAVVKARWQVRGRAEAGAAAVVRESVVRAQAADKSYDARVAALSRALADLTQEIADAITAMPRGAAAGHVAKPSRAGR